MSAPIPQAAFQSGPLTTPSVTMCPHCGFNFEADKPIVIGDWTLWPQFTSWAAGDVHLTASESGILYALAKASGEWVTAEAVLNRISDSENTNLVAVWVSRIRKKLGSAAPLESARGRRGMGYRWAVSA